MSVFHILIIWSGFLRTPLYSIVSNRRTLCSNIAFLSCWQTNVRLVSYLSRSVRLDSEPIDVIVVFFGDFSLIGSKTVAVHLERCVGSRYFLTCSLRLLTSPWNTTSFLFRNRCCLTTPLDWSFLFLATPSNLSTCFPNMCIALLRTTFLPLVFWCWVLRFLINLTFVIIRFQMNVWNRLVATGALSETFS